MKFTKKIYPVIFFVSLITFFQNILDTKMLYSFALFATTILTFILEIFPMGATALISLSVGGLLKIFEIKDALNFFASPIIWQLITIFFIAKGFVKTGLLKRLAYKIILKFGNTTLGLGYAITFSNFMMAPLIPSCAARVGGILLPLIKSISKALNSTVEDNTQKKIASFLILLSLFGNAIASASFLTAMAGNLMIQNAASSFQIELTWILWFKYAIVPALITLILTPLILYKIYPPELKNIQETKHIIQTELNEMGSVKFKEFLMIITFGFLLIGLIFGDLLKIDIILVSFSAVSFLLIAKILDFDEDILGSKESWHTLIWLSILLFLGQTLKDSQFLYFISLKLTNLFSNFSLWQAFPFIILVYAYSHYLFASNSSHISALYQIFLGTLITLKAPLILSALILAYSTSLFAGLNYYTSTEAAILYNSKFVKAKDFVFYGFVMSSIMFVIWMSVGLIWWKINGLY